MFRPECLMKSLKSAIAVPGDKIKRNLHNSCSLYFPDSFHLDVMDDISKNIVVAVRILGTNDHPYLYDHLVFMMEM